MHYGPPAGQQARRGHDSQGAGPQFQGRDQNYARRRRHPRLRCHDGFSTPRNMRSLKPGAPTYAATTSTSACLARSPGNCYATGNRFNTALAISMYTGMPIVTLYVNVSPKAAAKGSVALASGIAIC